jgi:hypothetical protein
MTEQGAVFGYHLLRRLPNKKVLTIYAAAIQQPSFVANQTDQRLLQFGLNHPWSISYIDAGLAYLRPQSEFRHRLYVMFAILESSREYHEHFLPKQRSPFYLFYIAYVAARSLVTAGVGLLLVKALSRANV